MFIDRTDKTKFGKWWLGLDKLIFFSTLALMFFGALMIFSAGPASAIRANFNSSYYIDKYIHYVGIGVFVFLFSSFLSIKQIKFLSLIGFLILFCALIATLFGEPIKGAKRWINIGMSLQPSEFLKPIFAIIISLILVRIKEFQNIEDKRRMKNNIYLLIGIFVAVISLLILQPDMGMTITFSVIFFAEVFVGGLSGKWIATLIGLGVSGLVLAYFSMPHFYTRINKFLGVGNVDTYQIDMGINAIKEAGLFGSHINNLKSTIPDVHTDFIFSAMVEEFGAILSIVLLSLFFTIIVRIFNLLKEKKNPFVIFACTGITSYITFQIFVNVASNLKLIPTKGMTLPFISYGGSSFVSSCFAMGILLALIQEYNVRGEYHEKRKKN